MARTGQETELEERISNALRFTESKIVVKLPQFLLVYACSNWFCATADLHIIKVEFDKLYIERKTLLRTSARRGMHRNLNTRVDVKFIIFVGLIFAVSEDPRMKILFFSLYTIETDLQPWNRSEFTAQGQ